MRVVPLADVCVPVDTWNPAHFPDSRFDYIDLSAIDNETKSVVGSTSMAGAEAPSRARQLVRAGDVLVSTVRPNLNAVAVVPPQLDGAVASTGFAVLRPSAKLDRRFLFHWVRSPGFVVEMVRRATGASYPAVSDRIVRGSAIPELPADEQLRIAAILDAADAIRNKRREILAHLDALAQSVFHDMFATHSAVATTLGDLAEVTSGITKGRRTSRETFPTPYLAVSNVQAGFLRLDSIKTIAATEDEIARYSLAAGDLVLTEGGDPDKLGRGTVWRSELPLCLHQNHVFRVRVHDADHVRPDYLAHFTAGRSARSYFLRAAKQTTGIATINSSQLRSLPVLVPPLPLQQAFASRIERIDAQRAVVARALAADDELFASLQFRAFRGEL